MTKDSGDKGRYRDETLLSVLGRDPAANHGVVNPPVYHASTILHESAAALKEATFGPREYGKTYYGRYGTPTTFPLQDSIATLEKGYRTYLFGSGKAAIVAALLAFVKSGDHVLMTDSAYGPTRSLANGLLKRMGVETTFYDPCIGAGIAELMRANTSVVVGESPGSLTFEIQDFPALAAAAHERGAVLVVDNTWASPLFCQPLVLGADISIQAGTKYIVGHSDAMLGAVTTTEAHVEALRRIFEELGAAPGPDDCYLGLRGLRTLSVRLHRHQETGLALAHWFRERPEVRQVLHPRVGGRPRPRPCGSAISRAHRASSAWCWNRCRSLRSMPSSIPSRSSASAIPGAATRASRSPPIPGSSAMRPAGIRPIRCSASTRGLRTRTISLLTWSGVSSAWRRSATPSSSPVEAPDLFLFAAREMSTPPERCLVIEDSAASIEAGLAAGMNVWRYVGGSHIADVARVRDETPAHVPVFDNWDQFYLMAPELRA